MTRKPSRSSNYDPPQDGKVFVEKWEQLIGNIITRDNFNLGHLYQLEILCGLYEELDTLNATLAVTGHTYESVVKGVTHHKAYPQVGQLNVCRNQIAAYTRMLGLTIAKNLHSSTVEEEKDEWE